MKKLCSPSITISDLHLRYQHQWLFDEFNFALPAGKWTCLLGPSGIGKSSLLRFIAQLPYGFNTECRGNIISSNGDEVRKITSYLTQHDSLLPWLTVFENLFLGFKLRSEKIGKVTLQYADELLIRVGLAKAKNLKPRELSAGMKQRVMLLRTLIEDRPVVLMDEPFSALDSMNRLKIQNLAVELLAGRTVLLVTHDPLEALRLGDVIHLVNGAPANIIKTIELQQKKPRELDSTELAKEWKKLMHILHQSDEELV